MKLEQVTDRVQRLAFRTVNSYLVQLVEGGAVLIDAGLPAHGRPLGATLRALGFPPAALRGVLLTHRHLDHVGGAAALREQGAPSPVIHEGDHAALSGRERLTPARGLLRHLVEPLMAFSDRRLFGFRPVDATPAGDDFALAELRLLPLPGHTPGHVGWVLAGGGVVFAGDAAMNLGGRLTQPSGPFTLDPAAARAAQRRLADLDAAVYCFGHGPPLHRGAAALRQLSER